MLQRGLLREPTACQTPDGLHGLVTVGWSAIPLNRPGFSLSAHSDPCYSTGAPPGALGFLAKYRVPTRYSFHSSFISAHDCALATPTPPSSGAVRSPGDFCPTLFFFHSHSSQSTSPLYYFVHPFFLFEPPQLLLTKKTLLTLLVSVRWPLCHNLLDPRLTTPPTLNLIHLEKPLVPLAPQPQIVLPRSRPPLLLLLLPHNLLIATPHLFQG